MLGYMGGKDLWAFDMSREQWSKWQGSWPSSREENKGKSEPPEECNMTMEDCCSAVDKVGKGGSTR